MQVTTIGLDLAKSTFQVHGVDAAGRTVLRRRLRRSEMHAFFASVPPCLVGLEACAGAHWWAREIAAFGHEVRLMPARYVRPYVKRNKNDAADAEAIGEAVTRPSMRFVPVKGAAQQSVLLLHRTRELLVRQRTMLINALRGHLGEFGIVAAQGTRNVAKLVAIMAEADDKCVPPLASQVLRLLVEQLRTTESRLVELERDLLAWHRANEVSQRLATVPGIGPITATAIAATVGDGSAANSIQSAPNSPGTSVTLIGNMRSFDRRRRDRCEAAFSPLEKRDIRGIPLRSGSLLLAPRGAATPKGPERNAIMPLISPTSRRGWIFHACRCNYRAQ